MSHVPTRPVWSESAAEEIPLHRSVWHKLMLAWALLIALDPIRVFEEPLLQQIPVVLVIGYLALAFLHRPLAPLRSTVATIFAAMVLWALPGIIYNKLSEYTGMFTAVMLFLIPISAAYPVGNAASIDARKMLIHVQWIGIAYFVGSLIRITEEVRSEMLWYGIHERSFLLGFLFLPGFLTRSRLVFGITFVAACALLLLDFRATTAFCLVNSIFVAGCYRYKVPEVFVYIYVAIVIMFLLSAYLGYDLVWELYALVKGMHSQSINDEVRRATIQLAFDEWARAPIFGDFFSGGGAYDIRPYVAWWQGSLLPLHNDYLDFLVRGGIVGLAMLLLGLGSALVIALRNMTMLNRRGDEKLGMWNAFLLATLINILFVISFNPVLKTVSHAFVVQLVLAWMVALEIVVKNGIENKGVI